MNGLLLKLPSVDSGSQGCVVYGCWQQLVFHKGMEKIFFPICTHLKMDGVKFEHFAGTRNDYTGRESVVDVCLHAMKEGTLSLTANQWEKYLWELYDLTTDQLARVCVLLQRQRLPASLLWRSINRMHWTKRSALEKSHLVSEDPDAMAALSRIEFLWHDLDAVQAWLFTYARCSVGWIVAELDRRRQWFTGLRRQWLLAALSPSR